LVDVLPPDPLAGLLARVALRDRLAFQQLYSATSAKLFGVTLRILNNRAEAEEVLQEAFVKIWVNAGQYSPSGYRAMTWLAAIVRNQAIDRVRARKPQAVDLDDALDISDDGPTPEASLLNAAAGKQIAHCMEQLDQNRAEAVRRAYVDGVSYQELADLYRVPINTMRTWLRRSLATLRECLQA
jgi:RNA polymerase sigma-70 factor, ECF subfamily